MAIGFDTLLQIGINLLIFVGIIIIFGILGFIIYWIYKTDKRFDTNVDIFEMDGLGRPKLTYDVGGTYVDKKTNAKRFWLKKGKVGLNCDNVPSIPIERGKRKKTVYVLRIGEKNYRFINIRLPKREDIKIEVGEEDVNWALNSYEREKKRYATSFWEKIAPYATMALTVVFVIVIFAIFVQKFDVLKDIAASLTTAAEAIRQANTGTTVIT
jgi:hypothetical protein